MVVKYEINAFSLDEAKQKATEMGLTVVKNVTPSWKNAGEPKFGTNDFKTFMVETLEKKRLANSTGVGVIVTMEPGTADDRQRPYTFNNNVMEGSRATKRYFEVRLVEDGGLIGRYETKGEAARAAKAAMVHIKKDLYCEIVYRVVDPEMAIAFKVDYTPSTKTKMGKYVVFGNIIED